MVRTSNYFKASPADKILDGDIPVPMRVRARRLWSYPCRFALATHMAAVLLLAISKEVPEIADYVFWTLLPFIFCFLPTTGAVILKSFRRFLGTIVGGLASMACLWLNPGNKSAFLMQCFIITFFGKLASTSPKIGYAGQVFGLTWDIVVWSTWVSGSSDFYDALELGAWRMSMTTLGTVLSVIGALLLFPAHATRQLENRIAETILCTTEMSVLSMEHHLQHLCTEGEKSCDLGCTDTADEDVTMLCSHSNLEASVRQSAAQRNALFTEAQAERWLVHRRVMNLAALQASSASLLTVAASTESIGHASCPEEYLAAGHFLSSSYVNGPLLHKSICKVIGLLRDEAVSLALLLQGVRAPHRKLGQNRLRSAVRKLERHFRMNRKEILAQGKMPSLYPVGLLCFYAQMHGLSQYADEWMKLTDELFPPSEADANRGSLLSGDESVSEFGIADDCDDAADIGCSKDGADAAEVVGRPTETCTKSLMHDRFKDAPEETDSTSLAFGTSAGTETPFYLSV